VKLTHPKKHNPFVAAFNEAAKPLDSRKRGASVYITIRTAVHLFLGYSVYEPSSVEKLKNKYGDVNLVYPEPTGQTELYEGEREKRVKIGYLPECRILDENEKAVLPLVKSNFFDAMLQSDNKKLRHFHDYDTDALCIHEGLYKYYSEKHDEKPPSYQSCERHGSVKPSFGQGSSSHSSGLPVKGHRSSGTGGAGFGANRREGRKRSRSPSPCGLFGGYEEDYMSSLAYKTREGRP
jgi:hypothetical protein